MNTLDAIWEAAHKAITENMEPRDFVRIAREAWEYEMKQWTKDCDNQFKEMLKKE